MQPIWGCKRPCSSFMLRYQRRGSFFAWERQSGNEKLQGREGHYEHGSAFGGVECRYRAIETLYDFLHDGQAKASAAAVASARGITAVETLEQKRRIVFDAAAIIFHGNNCLVVHARKQNPNMSALFDVANGVVDQIDDGLLEAIGGCPGCRGRRPLRLR